MTTSTPTQIASGSSSVATTTASFTAQPAGTMLLLWVAADDYIGTAPSGWTLREKQEGNLGFYLYWKIAAGSETSVAYTIGSASKSRYAVLACTNVNGTTPWNNSASTLSAIGGSNTTYATPSSTPTGSGDILALGGVGIINGSTTVLTFSGWTSSFTEISDGGVASGSYADSFGVAYLNSTAAGAGITTTATTSGIWSQAAGITAILNLSAGTTRVTKTAATSWAVVGRVVKTAASSWSVRARAAKTAASSWSVRTRPTPLTAATSWAVRTRATPKTVAMSWAVRSRDVSTVATSWVVRGRVGKTAASSWSVRTRLGSTAATSWIVRARVAGSVASSWVVRARVATSVATTWVVNITSGAGRFNATFATSWVVRARVAGTSSTSWVVRARVGKTAASSWSVRTRPTPFTAATSWSVRTRTGTTKATSWSVRARAGSTVATSWVARSRPAFTVPVSWSVRTRSAKTTSSSWVVRAHVVKTMSTSWAVRSRGGRIAATSWVVESNAVPIDWSTLGGSLGRKQYAGQLGDVPQWSGSLGKRTWGGHL